ncbi:MAG: nucleotidyltransferase family protein [Chromatiales bacterium]|nr:nucleotidyltransferase family protein [Chromatiales bacterium]
MTRDETLRILRQHKPEIIDRFGVAKLAIFGSTARNEATESSDLDVLVSFEGKANSRRYFGLQFFLEDLLSRPVDLVTDRALRAELKPYIERDLLNV